MTIRLGDTAPDFTAETTRARSTSTNGSATAGASCSPTRRTSRRSARPSSATSPSSSPSSTSATSRSSASRSTRSTTTTKWAADIEETQGAAGELPDDRRPGQQGRRPLRHDPPERQRHPHGALGVRHRPRQEGEAHHHLPAVDGPQLRRDPPRRSTRCSSPPATAWRRRSTGRTARTSSSCRPCPTTRPRRKFPKGWKTVKPYLRLTPQPNK